MSGSENPVRRFGTWDKVGSNKGTDHACDGAREGDRRQRKGMLPTTEMLEAMGRYNEELVNAGIMRDADGLKPSSHGKRIAFDGAGRTVIDGPFARPASSSPASGSGTSRTWTRRSPG
jgi:hypothetical protein